MNGFDVCKDTGLILVANDEPKIGAFFIPQLGTAPNWCGFLENLTEEMEEQHNLSVFEGFKFLTYEEIEKLNCANLIGTPAIKPHMHGRNVFLTKRVFDGVESI
jgi:ribosome biogenesis protein ENP2